MGVFSKVGEFLFGKKGSSEKSTSYSSTKNKEVKNKYANISESNPYITSSGKKYTSAWDLARATNYAKSHRTYKDVAQDAIKKIQYNNEVNKLKEEENYSRGTLDRIFGLLGNNSIPQALYNITDDDENTTFFGGIADGIKYMNPFEDDVKDRKYMSDVFKNLGWEDKDPDHLSLSDVGRGVTGFVGDVLLDPTTYIPVAGIGSKILKGSGYTVDAAKNVAKNLEENTDTLINQINSFQKVASYMNDPEVELGKKISQVTGFSKEEAAEILNRNKNTSNGKWKTPEEFQQDFAETVHHINFGDKDDITIGFNNLPFVRKKAEALKKTIIPASKLREIGDRTISPYYNSLAKSLRISRLGQALSKNNKMEAMKYNDKAAAIKIIDDLQNSVIRAEKDIDDLNFATRLDDWEKKLTDDERIEFLQAYETGILEDAVTHKLIINALKEKGLNIDNLNDVKLKNKKIDEAPVRESIEEKKERIMAALDEKYSNMERFTDNPYADLFRKITGKRGNKYAKDEDIIDVLNVMKNMKNIDVLQTAENYYRSTLDDINKEINNLYSVIKSADGMDEIEIERINKKINTLTKKKASYGSKVKTIDGYISEGDYENAAKEVNRYIKTMKPNELKHVLENYQIEINENSVETGVRNLFDNYKDYKNEISQIKKYKKDKKRADKKIEKLNKQIENADMWEAYKVIGSILGQRNGSNLKYVNDNNIKGSLEWISENNDYISKIQKAGEWFEGKEDGLELLGKFEDRMREVASKEVDLGMLDEKQASQMRGRYILHKVTDEFLKKKGIDRQEFEKNGGFTGLFGSKGRDNKTRLLRGTIKELNEEYKEKYGVKVFEDTFSDLYLSRVLHSNETIFNFENMKFVKSMFSEPVPYADGKFVVNDGRILATTFNDLNRMINNNVMKEYNIKRNKFIYAVRRDWCEKRGEPFIRDDNSIKAHQEKNEIGNLYDMKNGHIKDEIRERIMQDIFGDDEKKRALFTPNIPIQELSQEQCAILKRKYDYMPEQYLKETAEKFNIMSKTQKIECQGQMLNMFDKFQNIWKLNQTIVSPGFHVQNFVSNAFQSYLGLTEGYMNPKKLKRAYDVLSLKDPKQTLTLNGTKYTYKELEHYAKKIGVINESFSNWDFGGKQSILEYNLRGNSLQKFKDVKWKGMKSINPLDIDNFVPYQIMTVPGTNIETVQRMNLFLCSLEEGKTLEEAAKNVNKYLFDYSDLTKQEENVLKRIIPFYTFMRKNFPMEIEAMLNNSTKFSQINYGINEFEKMNEDTYIEPERRNEWRTKAVQIPGTEYGININLASDQLDRFVPTSQAGIMDKIMGMSSPLTKVPYELAIRPAIRNDMYEEEYNPSYAYTGIPIDNEDNNAVLDYGMNLIGGLPNNIYNIISEKNDEDKMIKDASSFLGLPIVKIKEGLTKEDYDRIREIAYNKVYKNN